MIKYLAAVLIFIFTFNINFSFSQTTSESDRYHLIKWTQEWCGPCKTAHSELSGDPRYAALNPEDVDPDNLKTQDEKIFFQTEKINSYPTFVLYRKMELNGRTYLREIGRVWGYNNKNGKETFFRQIKDIKSQYPE